MSSKIVPGDTLSATDANRKDAGTKAFSTLTVIPLDRLSSAENMKAKLIKRGGLVESYAGTHYRAYNGLAWRLDERDQLVKYSVKGRVVLDAYGWDQFNPNNQVYVTAL